jgi:A/G-specific adenine glycosylase
MVSGIKPEDFRQRLLGWFDENARDLPWRRSRDPYAIWVSEIMLQQTRVAAVLEHYARFMERFPALALLAAAGEEEVLALWSGLGYYRRARLLHRAAQFVAHQLGGKLPENATNLRVLPGVGEYTAAAVASIGFGEPIACVDGNVERVLRRLMAWKEISVTAAKTRAQAACLLDAARPGDFNQAMMELGATVCLPRGPLCLQCPVVELCATRGEHPAGARKKMRSRESAYAFLRRSPRPHAAEVLLEQRPADSSLMPGMWELPEIDPKSAPEENKALTLRHSITDTNYYVSIYRLDANRYRLPERSAARQWCCARDLQTLPLTGLARKALKRLHAWPGYDGAGPEVALGPLPSEVPV